MKKSIFLLLVILLMSCQHQEKKETIKTYTVANQQQANHLFYSGIVTPLTTSVITAPVDGVISQITFNYGEMVNAKKLLFIINSDKYVKDYKSALMDYVKAKNDFDNNKMQLTESEFLHKNKLISDDEYKMKQSSFYGARLNLLQARDAVQQLHRGLDVQEVDLGKINIANIEKMTEALHLSDNTQQLKIYADNTGIILAPPKETETKLLQPGDAVKQGDAMVVVGDMSGIVVRIKVNELTVNQLKVGQAVKVTGAAFADLVLQGKIKSINHQAQSAGNGLPMFSVDIIVPSISADAQKIINVGMSANIDIAIQEQRALTVPINAVHDVNGQTHVHVLNNNQQQKRIVSIGKTTKDTVSILSGLRAGETIVLTR